MSELRWEMPEAFSLRRSVWSRVGFNKGRKDVCAKLVLPTRERSLGGLGLSSCGAAWGGEEAPRLPIDGACC